jgi:hypothetical protein
MKRIITMVLIGLLVAPPASAGQTPGKPIEWQKARTLKAGTEIVLTVAGGQPRKVRVLFVDEATLVTLEPTTPKLSGGVEKFLVGVGPKWPAVLSGSATSTAAPLRVSKEGIFDGDQKLAALADVVQQTSRGDVKEIAKPRAHGRLIGWLVVGGILLFVVVGMAVAAAGD